MSINIDKFISVFDEVLGLAIVNVEVDLSGGVQTVEIYLDDGYLIKIDSYTNPMLGISGIVKTDVSLYKKVGLYNSYSLIKKYDDSDFEEEEEGEDVNGDDE